MCNSIKNLYCSIKNLYLGLKEQGPLKRAFRNFFITGNAWGLFSKYSHVRKDGVPKISYKHKESAIKAAQKMEKKMVSIILYINVYIVMVTI